MSDQEKLYEVMGELLYAVAKADGVIQPSEQKALENLLSKHPWAQEVNWSFAYEKGKDTSVEEAYKKAVSYCQAFGPSHVYAEFIEAMKTISAANGIEPEETALINSFSQDLTTRFMRDVEVNLD